jgi:hypothetical protein
MKDPEVSKQPSIIRTQWFRISSTTRKQKIFFTSRGRGGTPKAESGDRTEDRRTTGSLIGDSGTDLGSVGELPGLIEDLSGELPGWGQH